MSFFEKIKKWVNKNKKYVLIGGTVLLTVGSGIVYVVCKKGKIPFGDWVKMATTKELEEAYEKLRLEVFYKTGERTPLMERISSELSARSAKEWFEKHPPKLDPNFRWTDVNRWE